MLKLNASYGKKIPVEGEDFSSRSYHASIEVEIPEGLAPDELRDRIHETFSLVRESVEAELRGTAPARETRAPATGRSARPPARRSQRASSRQIDYLTDLALRKGLEPRDLADLAARRYGAERVSDLSRQQASALIDSLNGEAPSGRPGKAA